MENLFLASVTLASGLAEIGSTLPLAGVWRSRQRWGADAVVGEQGLGVWERGGDAGRGYGVGFFEALGDGLVQLQKLGQQVLLGGEAVIGENGGAQGGVGVFEMALGSLWGAYRLAIGECPRAARASA